MLTLSMSEVGARPSVFNRCLGGGIGEHRCFHYSLDPLCWSWVRESGRLRQRMLVELWHLPKVDRDDGTESLFRAAMIETRAPNELEEIEYGRAEASGQEETNEANLSCPVALLVFFAAPAGTGIITADLVVSTVHGGLRCDRFFTAVQGELGLRTRDNWGGWSRLGSLVAHSLHMEQPINRVGFNPLHHAGEEIKAFTLILD